MAQRLRQQPAGPSSVLRRIEGAKLTFDPNFRVRHLLEWCDAGKDAEHFEKQIGRDQGRAPGQIVRG